MNLPRLEEYLNSKEYEERLTSRLEINKLAQDNYFKRQQVIANCINDPKYFINNFCWLNEPRNIGNADLEFFLFPYQNEVIDDLYQAETLGEDRLFEKSRDLGFTWMMTAYYLWRWKFSRGWIGLFGSRKQEEVDNRCYSDDTEVLTKDGWKLFKDVDITKDLFATRNKKTKEFEWQKAFYKHHDYYEGDFYHINTRTLDLMVSPNHRVLYRNNPWGKIQGKYDSNERISKAEDLYKRGDSLITIPATSKWTGKEINNFTFKGKDSVKKAYGRGRIYQTKATGFKMEGDDYCAFMGMWLAEGCKKDKGFFISQMEKSKGYEEYKNLLIKIFEVEPYYNGLGWGKGNSPIYDYIKQFGLADTKFIPQEIMDSTPRQLGIFLHYYMLGDGCFSAQPTMGTVSKKMADQLQEAIQKLGFSAMIQTEIAKKDRTMKDGRIIKKENCLPFYRLNIRTSRYQTINIKKTKYKGDIWCVSVPNEILYVRRNGKPVWCGNTISSFFGKLRFMFYRLPDWMIPKNFKKKMYDNENKLFNPEINSLIQGESSNPNFGRDRRSSITVIDELFLHEYAQDMWRNVAETSKCRIGVSTPKPTRFAKTLKEAMSTNGWLRSYHWSKHPFKDQEWYEEEKKRYLGDEMGLRMELELEYLTNPDTLVYPQAELIKIEHREYQLGNPIYVSLDWGSAPSATVFCWWQRQDKWVLLEALQVKEKHINWYMPFLCPDVPVNLDYKYDKYEQEVLDKVRKWSKAFNFYGEAAHWQKNMTTSTSIAQELMKDPYRVQLRYNPNAIGHQARQAAVKELIRQGVVFNDTYYCSGILDSMSMAHFPKTQGTREKEAPVHDETADARSAVENFAVNVMGVRTGIKVTTYNKKYANIGRR